MNIENGSGNGANSSNGGKPETHGGTQIVALGKTTVLNNPVDANLASALGYFPFLILGPILSVILLNSPSENRNFNRFHAVQSLTVFGATLGLAVVINIIGGVLAVIPLVNLMAVPLIGLINMLLWAAYILVSGFCGWSAFQGKTFKLPYLGPLADSMANK